MTNELEAGYEFTRAQIAELESLRAWKAEIERQEPVGKTIAAATNTGYVLCTFNGRTVPVGTKLYAAPVISPDSAARIAELEAEVARLRKIIDEEAADSGQIIIERDKLQSNLEASTVRLNESLYQQSRLQAENEALRKDAERYRLALSKIEYSMSQALIPGNDKWREILLSKDIAESAIEQAKGGA